MNPVTRALILGFTALLIGFPLVSWAVFLSQMVPDGRSDFRAYYSAGYMLRTGLPLYDYSREIEVQNRKISRQAVALPFIHPAFEALLYLPLSFLTYLQAYWVWFGVNVTALICAYRLLRRELQALFSVAPWLPAATVFAFLPIGAAIVQGQDSILVLLLFAGAFSYFRRSEHLFAAGMLLGLAVFRFQIVVPIVFCFLLWRRFKVVIGFSITATAAAALSVAIAGIRPYVHTLLGFRADSGLSELVPVSLMPNLRGLVHSLGGSDLIVIVASFAVLGVTVYGAAGRDLQHQFTIAVVAATLVSYHGLVHDLSVLFIPLTLLIGTRRNLCLVFAGIGFFAPTLVFLGADSFYLATIPVLALFIFFVVLCRRNARAAEFVKIRSACLPEQTS